jgi:hypothetical protein
MSPNSRIHILQNSAISKSILNWMLFFFFFFLGGTTCKMAVFFGGTGVWTQDFALAKQVLSCLSLTSSLFCSAYFRHGIPEILIQADLKLWPTRASHLLSKHSTTWATPPLLISASWIARITGVSHQCLTMVVFHPGAKICSQGLGPKYLTICYDLTFCGFGGYTWYCTDPIKLSTCMVFLSESNFVGLQIHYMICILDYCPLVKHYCPLARAFSSKCRLSLNSWGKTVQVYWVVIRGLGPVHSKANKNCEVGSVIWKRRHPLNQEQWTRMFLWSIWGKIL